MSRPAAVLVAVLLFGLVFVETTTERNLSAITDKQTLIVNVVAQVLLALGLFVYCGFAALHSTQHIDSPQERTVWLIATVILNVLGSCWYYLTVYQSFRKTGHGGLMRFKKTEDNH